MSTVKVKIASPVPLTDLLAILHFAATIDDDMPILAEFGDIVLVVNSADFAAAVEE
jgi:hypothetical protein